MENNNNVLVEKEKEAGKIYDTVEVLKSCTPRYEIIIPDSITSHLGLTHGDTLNFIEKNSRIYIEKA